MNLPNHYRFLFEGHKELLTNDESVAWNNLKVQRLIEQCDYPAVKELFKIRWLSDEPAVLALLENGSEAFYSATIERISNESPSALNRCPKCQTLCRTSRARQCPSCSHNWFTNRNSGNSLLFQAIWNNDIETLKRFISQGYDLNTLDQGDPLIYAAIENCSLECLELLLKHGASVDTEMRGWSPLRWAVEQEVCAASEGVWPTENNDWRRPVTSITSILLKYGANPLLSDSKGQNAYSYAKSRKHLSFLELVNTQKSNSRKE